MVVLCLYHSQVTGSIPRDGKFCFYFPEKQQPFVLNLLMRWPNTSGLPAQWKMRFTQSLVCMVRTLLCLNFFDGFVGEMKHINKIGYPWLPHVNTWCDGSASRKWAWWSKDRILGHAVFLLEYLCVQILFWSFLSSTLLCPHIFAFNISASNL